jgi:hypothetical protein
MPHPPRWYRRFAWVLVVLAFILMAVSGIWYTHYVQVRSDQRLCKMWVQVDDQYQAHPPATQSGRDFATTIHNLRHEYHCKSEK